jgi:hypothetical protein
MKEPEMPHRIVKQATPAEGVPPHVSRHKRIVLEDGRRLLECKCGKTIANRMTDEGREKVKIILWGDHTRDTSFDLGGRCLNCQTMHHIEIWEIACILGYDNEYAFFEAEGYFETEDVGAWWNYFHRYCICRFDGNNLLGGSSWCQKSQTPSEVALEKSEVDEDAYFPPGLRKRRPLPSLHGHVLRRRKNGIYRKK